MRVERLPEFKNWFESLNSKGQAQVDARLFKIEESDYFGDAKDLGGALAELRWKNGRRVYFSKRQDASHAIVILILGGNKNGQTKDINKARLLLRKYVEREA